ncbi:MAG: ATP-binding protein, partial [Planctomycetota bacterium]|nr:ATP-binding protein [Planctomycetota bacterium]
LKDRLVVTNDTKHLTVVREFIARLIQQSALSKEDENKIILAVDEAVTNVIEHGYDNQNDGSIEIDVVSSPSSFKITIRDTGKVLNVQDHVKMGRKKGLGIFLMRQIMDEVKYTFRDGVKNELTMVKLIK